MEENKVNPQPVRLTREQMWEAWDFPGSSLPKTNWGEKYLMCRHYSCPYSLCCFGCNKEHTGCSNEILGFGWEKPNGAHEKTLYSCCECDCYDGFCESCFLCD